MLKSALAKLRTTRLIVAAASLSLTTGVMAQVFPANPIPPAKPVAAAVTMPSVDTLQKDLDTGQYHDAIHEASRLLALRGPDAAGLSRFQIMMMRGYAQVGSKLTLAAIDTFRSALKETNDPRECALARWTAELFRRSHGPLYVPKVLGANPVPPINLLDPDGRMQAFALLLDSDLAALEPKIKIASASLSLMDTWPVVQRVKALAELDTIAYGNQDRVNAVAGGLLDHSRNLLTASLKGMWVRTNDIEIHANIASTSTVNTVDAAGNSIIQTISVKNGLSDANRQDLNNIITTCGQIHEAAQIFGPLSPNDKDWLTILADSDRVGGRASDVLNTNYGSDSSAIQNATSPVYNQNTNYDSGYSGGNNTQQFIYQPNQQPNRSQQAPTTPPAQKPVQAAPVPQPVQAPAPPVFREPPHEPPHLHQGNSNGN